MKSICGINCDECSLLQNKKCQGCNKMKGCFGKKKCWIYQYIEVGGKKNYDLLKKEIIDEFNTLHIDGMPKVTELYPLFGEMVNLDYPLPNGKKEKILCDDEMYLGNQLECEFNDDKIKKCFGLVANMTFLLICEYEENGLNPEIIVYKKR